MQQNFLRLRLILTSYVGLRRSIAENRLDVDEWLIGFGVSLVSNFASATMLAISKLKLRISLRRQSEVLRV